MLVSIEYERSKLFYDWCLSCDLFSLSLSLSLSVLSWASFSDDLFVSIFCSAHFSLRHLTASITAFEEHQAETAESKKKAETAQHFS